MTLRESLEAVRAGPALIADLPCDEVDIERLVTHLANQGFSGGVHLVERDTESLLWVYGGAPRDVWFFESGGSEAALAGVLGHDLFHQMAARGGTVTVLAGEPPGRTAAEASPQAPEASSAAAVESARDAEAPAAPPEPALIAPSAPAPGAGSSEIAASPRVEPAIPEPPAHPWAAILEDVAARVARHRGPKLAARFVAALDAALAAHGGRVEDGRVVAPELSESTWRIVVEAACAPITAVAGRAFVDRTIAAADRDARRIGTDEGGPR